MTRKQYVTVDDMLSAALRYDQQAKLERDPVLIGHCLREREWFLNEAIRLEQLEAEAENRA